MKKGWFISMKKFKANFLKNEGLKLLRTASKQKRAKIPQKRLSFTPLCVTKAADPSAAPSIHSEPPAATTEAGPLSDMKVRRIDTVFHTRWYMSYEEFAEIGKQAFATSPGTWGSG